MHMYTCKCVACVKEFICVTASSLDFQLNSISSLLVEGVYARVVAGYHTLMSSLPLSCPNRGSGVHQWNWIYLGLCVYTLLNHLLYHPYVTKALQAKPLLFLDIDPFNTERNWQERIRTGD